MAASLRPLRCSTPVLCPGDATEGHKASDRGYANFGELRFGEVRILGILRSSPLASCIAPVLCGRASYVQDQVSPWLSVHKKRIIPLGARCLSVSLDHRTGAEGGIYNAPCVRCAAPKKEVGNDVSVAK